jgi:peptide/nickel transport system permease protein
MVVFALLFLTGDPAALMLPVDATPQQAAQFRHQLGLDDPLPVQYGRFLGGVARGNFGESLRSREPALPLVIDRLPATMQLAVTALVLSVIVALPLGILAAVKHGSWVDRAAMSFALFGQSVPVFWLGIMLILLLAVQLRWFPSGGRSDLASLVLPAVTLGLFGTARTARLVRSGMLDVLRRDYIRTAYAKGLTNVLVLRRHALKNALIPVVTILGLDLATLLGGAVITETVFSWPGVGRLVVTSIAGRDYPVVQAAVFVVASSYILINLAVDVLYAYLDPRIRLG